MKKIINCLKESQLQIILSTIITFVSCFLEKYTQVLIFSIFNDRLFFNDELLKFVVRVVTFIIIIMFLNIIISFLNSNISNLFACLLRKKVFNILVNMPFAKFISFNSQEFITILDFDIPNITQILENILNRFLFAIFELISSVFIIFAINKKLGFFILMGLIVCLFALIISILYSLKFSKKLAKQFDILNEFIDKRIGNIKLIKSTSNEECEYNKFTKCTSTLKSLRFKSEFVLNFNSPIISLVIFFFFIFILLFYYKSSLKFKAGIILTLIYNAFSINFNLYMIFSTLAALSTVVSSFSRVLKVLSYDCCVLLQQRNNYVQILDKKINYGAIEFENVSFKHERIFIAFDNMNFRIDAKESVLIRGNFDEEKMILAYLIAGLLPASSGKILIDSQEIKKIAEDEIKSRITLISNNSNLFMGTIAENITLGIKFDEKTIYDACKKAQVFNDIFTLKHKLNTYVNPNNSNFSGGQKQKICLARIFLRTQTKILIVDNALSAIDNFSKPIILKNINETFKKTTKIWTNCNEASYCAVDKIISLKDGMVKVEEKK